jgi:hypothetical protein
VAQKIHIFDEEINELDSWRFRATLTKDDGSPLGSAALTALTLTVYDLETNGIINGLNQANILNAGRGTIDAAGNLTVALESADNPVVTSDNLRERHRARVIGSWNSGKGHTSKEFEFTIVNLSIVP